MRFREKSLIFFVAIILSVLGFNLISSSLVELQTLTKEADTDTVENYLVNCAGEAYQERNIIDNSLQFNCSILCIKGVKNGR